MNGLNILNFEISSNLHSALTTQSEKMFVVFSRNFHQPRNYCKYNTLREEIRASVAEKFFFWFFVDPTHSPNKRGHPKNNIPNVSYRSILIKLLKNHDMNVNFELLFGAFLTSRFFSHPKRSRGGDLFTDFDAEASEIYGAEVHSGVLSAAVALERELRREKRKQSDKQTTT